MANPLANLGHYAHPPKVVKIVKAAQATSAPVRPMPSMNALPPPAFAPMKSVPAPMAKRQGMQIPITRDMPTMLHDEPKSGRKTVKIVRAK